MIIIEFFTGFILAIPVAFLISSGVKYLDYMMDFGGYLWKLRYWLAKRYTHDIESLEASLDKAMAAQYNDQQAIMAGAYESIASTNLKFTRWICVICMSGYFSMFISPAVGSLLLADGQGLWAVLSFIISSIVLTFKFAST